MADQIELEIVTPDRLLVHEHVESVEIPGKAGCIGVLPGHAPLITELTIGEISYKHKGTTEHLSVAWGFAEVLPEKVTILAQTAERVQDIDVKRAEKLRPAPKPLYKKAHPISTTKRLLMRSSALKCD